MTEVHKIGKHVAPTIYKTFEHANTVPDVPQHFLIHNYVSFPVPVEGLIERMIFLGTIIGMLAFY